LRPTARPTRTPAPLIPVETTTPQANTPTPGLPAGTDVFFRLASDWGSAYPNQEVRFTLVVRNTRAADAGGANNLNNVTLRSVLPNNLEVLGAQTDRTDPTIAGQEVRYTITQLQPGEGVELSILTRIRPNVAAGTLLVVQGQLLYDGLAQPAFSNIASVLVVSAAQPTAVQVFTVTPTAPAATATNGAYPPPSSPTAPPATTMPPSAVPTLAPSATAIISQPQPPATPPPTAPLPETSTGVPLLGVLLLGLTLFTRTWRLHRSRERI
jgi:hypothetical protein